MPVRLKRHKSSGIEHWHPAGTALYAIDDFRGLSTFDAGEASRRAQFQTIMFRWRESGVFRHAQDTVVTWRRSCRPIHVFTLRRHSRCVQEWLAEPRHCQYSNRSGPRSARTKTAIKARDHQRNNRRQANGDVHADTRGERQDHQEPGSARSIITLPRKPHSISSAFGWSVKVA